MALHFATVDVFTADRFSGNPLAVVLDAFSRRVIGWALGRTLEAGLAIAALEMALAARKPVIGLVHHSDRGVQYASQGYTDLLKQHNVEISMSRKGAF